MMVISHVILETVIYCMSFWEALAIANVGHPNMQYMSQVTSLTVVFVALLSEVASEA